MVEDKDKELKKFDLVQSDDSEISLGVIVSEPFTVHLFDTAIGSQMSGVPFDITDPNSYDWEFDDFVLVYVFVPGRSNMVLQPKRLVNLRKADFESNTGYIPFDYGTDQLREVLSIIQYAYKLWGKGKAVRADI